MVLAQAAARTAAIGFCVRTWLSASVPTWRAR